MNLCIFALGCSGGRVIQASCKATSVSQCTDFFDHTDAELATEKTTCEMAGHTWSTSACDRTGSFGGCHLTDRDAINWFYAGSPANSPAAVMTACNRYPYVAP